MNSSRFAAIGAFLGGLAVILGAFGAHGLEGKLTAHELDVWKTGAHYHLVHAVAMLAVALYDRESRLRPILWLWLVGIAIFSGSLYLIGLTHTPMFGAITPIGGLCLIVGWILLGVKLARTKGNER